MREGEGDHDKGQEVAIKGDSTSYLIDQLEELYAKLVSFMHAYRMNIGLIAQSRKKYRVPTKISLTMLLIMYRPNHLYLRMRNRHNLPTTKSK